MTARHYDAFGLRLAVECDDPAMMAAVHARLRRWAVVDQSPPDLRFEIRARPAATHAALLDIDSSGSRPVYDPPVGEVVYAEESDCLLVRKVGAVRAVCHPGAGRAEVLFDPSDARAYWYASHPVFTLCLVEMLRRRAFFNLHAAALARDGRGRGRGRPSPTRASVRKARIHCDTCRRFVTMRVCSTPPGTASSPTGCGAPRSPTWHAGRGCRG